VLEFLLNCTDTGQSSQILLLRLKMCFSKLLKSSSLFWHGMRSKPSTRACLFRIISKHLLTASNIEIGWLNTLCETETGVYSLSLAYFHTDVYININSMPSSITSLMTHEQYVVWHHTYSNGSRSHGSIVQCINFKLCSQGECTS
jgi:hypothetical protein